MFRRHYDEHHRFHSTEQYRAVIDGEFKRNYPIIHSRDDPAFALLAQGSQTFASFHVNETPYSVRRDILHYALQRAHSRRLQVSEHGLGGHPETYDVTLEEISHDLHEGKAKIFPSGLGFVLEAETRAVTVNRPGAHKYAVDLMGQFRDDQRNIIRAIKRELRDENISASYALLTLIYLGYDRHKIVDILSDTDFREKMKLTDSGAEIPHKSKRSVGEAAITDLTKLLGRDLKDFRVVSRMENHVNALEYLAEKYSFSPRPEEYETVPDVRVFTPMAVLVSGVEIAYAVAPPGFRDEGKRDYIFENYGEICTTRIKTAYRRSEDDSPGPKKRSGLLGIFSFLWTRS